MSEVIEEKCQEITLLILGQRMVLSRLQRELKIVENNPDRYPPELDAMYTEKIAQCKKLIFRLKAERLQLTEPIEEPCIQ